MMGLDPTEGLTGWNRAMRLQGDEKIDNGVCEIFRIDALKLPVLKDGKPVIDPYTREPSFVWRDLQVAEFAAPIDAVEIARVANVLGRIYAGEDEDQCQLIYESWPGPGMLTTQELLRLGYANLWRWEYIDDRAAEQTQSIGWRSSNTTQRWLWTRSRRHLMERRAKIRSPWLLGEYRDAVKDPDKMRAKAAYGSHDDRLMAANLCFWGGHQWTYDVERTSELVTETAVVDWQQRAPVLGEEHMSYRDAWAAAVDGWD
jgi:hypothetical protein